MPLFLLIWILVAGVLGGTAVAVKWDKIITALRGKRLAVLGARGVGKTHLIKFLTTGSIPAEYKQTVSPEKVSACRFQLKDLDLRIKELLDVSGDKADYGDWKKEHDKADVVFYLLRADQLIARDAKVEGRVRDDLSHIGDWRAARSPLFFIIGTHCDFYAEFATLSAGDFVDKFRGLPIVKDSVLRARGTQQPKVVVGSMKTVPDTEALVYQLFKQVTL